MWVEEDYCPPPLAMEKDIFLNKYSDDITVDRVSSETKWKRIDDIPLL